MSVAKFRMVSKIVRHFSREKQEYIKRMNGNTTRTPVAGATGEFFWLILPVMFTYSDTHETVSCETVENKLAYIVSRLSLI